MPVKHTPRAQGGPPRGCGEPSLFCDSSLLSQHNTFGLHGGVWGVDCVSRQGYNGFVIMTPCEC